MRRIGSKISALEPFILDVSEGVLIGGLAGFLFGLCAGVFLWIWTWQMWVTSFAMPDIFFAGKLGLWEGALLGGVVAFYFRLKLFLRE